MATINELVDQAQVHGDKVVIPGLGERMRGYTRLVGHYEHICGANGYNPELGDGCPGCDGEKRDERALDRAYKKLLGDKNDAR